MSPVPYPAIMPTTYRPGLTAAWKGGIDALFEVPRILSIPSDGEVHTVPVMELDVEATTSWLCVPHTNDKVYVKVCARRSLRVLC